MIRAADAPSLRGEELPGVMCQPISGKRSVTASSRNDGRSPASPSGVVAGRIVSSTACTRVPPSGSGTGTGTISRSKPPPCEVAAASWWDRAAKRSSSSRSIFQRAARSSAETPCETRPSG
jgi:hypothetical protein